MEILLRPLQRESVYGGYCKHWRANGDTFKFFTAAFGEQRKVLFLHVVVWHVEVQYLGVQNLASNQPVSQLLYTEMNSSFGNP